MKCSISSLEVVIEDPLSVAFLCLKDPGPCGRVGSKLCAASARFYAAWLSLANKNYWSLIVKEYARERGYT